MIEFREMIWLFHVLGGLCVGWLCGARFGALAGVAASLGGCALGSIVGLLENRLHHRVNAGAARISQRHTRLGETFAVSAHLISLGLGIAFWWIWINYLA